MMPKKRCPDCGHTDVRPDDGRHDALTCNEHLLVELANLRAKRKLKAEWWELWWNRSGAKPVFVPMYGYTTKPWVPDGCFPTREEAQRAKKHRKNQYDTIVHVKRYLKVKP